MASPGTPQALKRRRESVNNNVIMVMDKLLNGRNKDAGDEYFSPELVNHTPIVNTVGLADFKTKFLEPLLTAFPDLRWVSNEIISDSTNIVCRWTFVGTKKGEWLGKATGNKVCFEGCSIVHVDVDSIYEMKHFWDTAIIRKQLTQK